MSVPANVRSSDDVIGFEGHESLGNHPYLRGLATSYDAGATFDDIGFSDDESSGISCL